jgi:hypothetical protein
MGGSVLVLASAMLAGCGDPTMEVRSYYGPGIRFSGLGTTYAWVEPGPKHTMGTPEMRGMIREVVERELADKGFSPGAGGDAQFWVCCRLAKYEKQVSSVNPHGESLAEGSLVIDLVAPADRKLIWRGIAQARIRDSDSPDARRVRLDEAVDRLMEKFPPREESPYIE